MRAFEALRVAKDLDASAARDEELREFLEVRRLGRQECAGDHASSWLALVLPLHLRNGHPLYLSGSGAQAKAPGLLRDAIPEL